MWFIADLLFILANFQRKLQSDSLTIIDIEPELSKFLKKLDKLHKMELLGRWEELYKNTVAENETDNLLYGQLLWTKPRRDESSNKYVSSKRVFCSSKWQHLEYAKLHVV